MTPHGKANHIVVHSYTPPHWGAVRRRTPVEGQSYDNRVTNGKRNFGLYGYGVQAELRRSAGALSVQSTVLRGGRVASWEQLRISVACRQIRAGALMRPKISGLGIGEFPSANSRNSRNLARQSNIWSSAATATAARLCDGCRARARRQVVLSAQLLPISCLGFSECRSESNQRQSRNGWGHRPRKTIDRRNGVVSRRVAARTATATSEFMDVTAGETARIQLRTALLQHLRGDGALSDVGSGAVRSASGDGLGIHQPGSNTRGTRAKVQTPSGRAAEAATCPAVARSFEGRAA